MSLRDDINAVKALLRLHGFAPAPKECWCLRGTTPAPRVERLLGRRWFGPMVWRLRPRFLHSLMVGSTRDALFEAVGAGPEWGGTVWSSLRQGTWLRFRFRR